MLESILTSHQGPGIARSLPREVPERMPWKSGQLTSLLVGEPRTVGPLKQIIQYQLPRKGIFTSGRTCYIHKSGHSQDMEGSLH